MGPVDFSILEQFKELMGDEGEDEVKDLVTLYLEDAPNQIRAMKYALSGSNAEDFQRAAHSFKSSSANIGAFGLQTICLELETMGKENSLGEPTRELISKAESEFASVQTALNGFLSS
ncbi:Hpt domain-containing protein [Sansalvadorimonas sp. 2012CJ34-2]|uniref:Hpt domain-containing protein n=1 Tax=Parendozoicomonas callyspongiae TaxID=2942213 RepID=A0ABT0PKI1_9GAMM|nr:Hpt domain-containing protein [Sansalvadorimonas sp. 2012CJ34-2]MCL6271481.1 Hpt domain-containing protein [Sansalvadorimonas sp. 2012CJ34-2]